MIRQLARLALSWWRADRIRSSPRQGRLLRLAPGSALVVRGRPVVVVRRRVGRTSLGPYVAYECDSAGGPCELRVRPIGETHHSTVTFLEGRAEQSLNEDDVAAYPARWPKRNDCGADSGST